MYSNSLIDNIDVQSQKKLEIVAKNDELTASPNDNKHMAINQRMEGFRNAAVCGLPKAPEE